MTTYTHGFDYPVKELSEALEKVQFPAVLTKEVQREHK
jgi:hypothetical protein